MSNILSLFRTFFLREASKLKFCLP